MKRLLGLAVMLFVLCLTPQSWAQAINDEQIIGVPSTDPLDSPFIGIVSNVSYLLRDEFTTNCVEPFGTNCPNAQPGPGTRVVVDTGSRLTISGGKLTSATGGGSGDPGYWLDSTACVAGKLLKVQANVTSGNFWFGWDVDQTGTASQNTLYLFSGGTAIYEDNSQIVGTFAYSTDYQAAIVLRSVANGGAYYLFKGGTFTTWTLLWMNAIGTATPLYPSITGASGVWTSDFLRVPTATWLPTPLGYDTFTRGDGAIGSTEAAGPDAQTSPVKSWTSQVGTVAISGNKAMATALSGGIAIATINSGVTDVLVSAPVTKTSTAAGGVMCYVDSSNYIYTQHDGTNAQLIKVVATTPTTVITAAATYAAGAPLVGIRQGTSYSLFYNNVAVGTVQTISDATFDGCVMQGVSYKDTDSSVDNWLDMARGTGNEYVQLDSY